MNAGGNATFTASATGTPAPSYQWYFGSAAIAGATSSSYTKTNAQPADSGFYHLSASNLVTSVTSSNAALIVATIKLGAPQFVGGVLQFSFTGASGPGYTVQSSSNLVNWVTLANLTNTNGTVLFNDTVNTNSPTEFYRVLAAP